MTKEQIKYIFENNKIHDTNVYKFLLKQIRKNTSDIDIIKKIVLEKINKLISDDNELTIFTKEFNTNLVKKKLRNFDSLSVEEKILLYQELSKLNQKYRYILMQVANVGRSQSDVSEEMKTNRHNVSKIIKSSIDFIVKEIGDEL